MFTNHGAYALHMEDKLASIEPGKLADFVVLSGDPLASSEDEIRDLRVLATIIYGEVVHETSEFWSS